MGNFSNNAITDVGRMLLADVQAGAVFTPTRIVIGSGTMTGGATIQGMTDVITPVKSLTINKKKRTPDGKCVFGGVYTNEEVTEPFYFRELALYAKAVYHNEDGSVKSEGAETLYSYGNAGATADYMPAYSTSTVVEKQMDLVVWVGNEAKVNLTIESGLFVNQEVFESHASRHAIGGEDPITPESIGAAPDGYGLGGTSQFIGGVDLNDITENGWYSWGADCQNVPFNDGSMLVIARSKGAGQAYMFQVAFYDGTYDTVVKIRKRTLGIWGEWQNWSPDAFAPSGYGLGSNSKGFDFAQIDNITANGWYASASGSVTVNNITFYHCHLAVANYDGNACRQTLYPVAYDTVLTRMRYNGTWGEWEAVNPPMFTDVEYRTTDRYQGAAVYKKVDTAGNILWRKDGESQWRLLVSASAVAPATV